MLDSSAFAQIIRKKNEGKREGCVRACCVWGEDPRGGGASDRPLPNIRHPCHEGRSCDDGRATRKHTAILAPRARLLG